MARFSFTPGAERDVVEIFDAICERWSFGQASYYLRQMEANLETVMENPAGATRCESVREGYRKAPSGAHMVYFRIDGGEVEFVRVLPKELDFEPRA